MPTFDEYIERMAQAIAMKLGMPPGGVRLPVDAEVTAPIAVAAAEPLPVVAGEPIQTIVAEPVALAPATAIAMRRHVDGDPGECCDIATETTLAAVLAGLRERFRAATLSHLTAPGTYTLKAGPGVLHGVLCNGKAGTRVTVYDGLDAGGSVLAVVTANGWAALPYEGAFSIGLTLVLAGTWDITVAWA